MAAQVGKCTKNHWIAHLKSVNFICKICLSSLGDFDAPADLETTEFQYTYLTMRKLKLRGRWFTQGHTVSLYRARCLWSVSLQKETEGRAWPDKMNQREQPTSVSQSALNPFPSNSRKPACFAGKGLRKQLEDSGRTTDLESKGLS